MITEGSRGLSYLGEVIRNELLPKCFDPFMSTDARLTAMMMDLLSEDFDRAADVLVTERAELEVFFCETRPNLPEDLALQIGERLSDQIADLRIATLGWRADADMSLFILIHEAVEAACEAGEHWAIQMNDAAWRFIGNYAQHRAYHSKA